MYCHQCGSAVPEQARFCPLCGNELVQSTASTERIKTFEFPSGTTFDQFAPSVNAWLNEGEYAIHGAVFDVQPTLMCGNITPALTRLVIKYTPESGGNAYQLGIMMNTCADFGIGRGGQKASLSRQFTAWRDSHPEYEVVGVQEDNLSLGLSGGWSTLFFYRVMR